MFLRYLRADYQKTKRLSIRMAHIAVAIGTAAVFLAYYAISPWDAYTKTEAYYQVLGIGFPFLIGVFCAVGAEQELSAGAFWNMLSAPKRAVAFSSKWIILVLFGSAAVWLASVVFGTGYRFLLKEQAVKFSIYWAAAFVMAGSSIFLYILHLFLALRFDKGVTIGLGIVESLLSGLLLTGMGDGIWMYVPAAWASRFCTMLLRRSGGYDMGIGAWDAAVCICVVMTLAGGAAFGAWACRWDGIKKNE